MSDEIKMDLQTTSETKLTIYSASLHDSSTRMDCFGFSDSKIEIRERTHGFDLKLSDFTLYTLRDVLNRWYEEQVVHRGKP